MNKSYTLLSVANWVSSSFPTIRLILLITIVLLSLALIFTILFQPSNEGNGMNALSSESTSETFYAKNKSQTMESALKRLTVIFSVVIAVLTIAFFITVAIYRGV